MGMKCRKLPIQSYLEKWILIAKQTHQKDIKNRDFPCFLDSKIHLPVRSPKLRHEKVARRARGFGRGNLLCRGASGPRGF